MDTAAVAAILPALNRLTAMMEAMMERLDDIDARLDDIHQRIDQLSTSPRQSSWTDHR